MQELNERIVSEAEEAKEGGGNIHDEYKEGGGNMGI
jgi:hypothetical protein